MGDFARDPIRWEGGSHITRLCRRWKLRRLMPWCERRDLRLMNRP